jgi:hypothetical protein
MDDHSNPDLGRAMVSKKHWACKHAGLLETAPQEQRRIKTWLPRLASGEHEPNRVQRNPALAEGCRAVIRPLIPRLQTRKATRITIH